MATLSNKQRSEELYRAAYKCEEMKHKGCQRINCSTCPLYLPLYTTSNTEDQREMALIQTSAAMDYAAERERQSQQTYQQIGTVILIVAACLFLFFKCS